MNTPAKSLTSNQRNARAGTRALSRRPALPVAASSHRHVRTDLRQHCGTRGASLCSVRSNLIHLEVLGQSTRPVVVVMTDVCTSAIVGCHMS